MIIITVSSQGEFVRKPAAWCSKLILFGGMGGLQAVLRKPGDPPCDAQAAGWGFNTGSEDEALPEPLKAEPPAKQAGLIWASQCGMEGVVATCGACASPIPSLQLPLSPCTALVGFWVPCPHPEQLWLLHWIPQASDFS